ncbi:DUF1492 domain-containing protein [Lactiplantibacillus plantarum]|uniref:DUF1492 domain-containing protein n=1 Tax=Lactiplantibacillus plantarum TaxID=1590 RepID=UPI003965A62A
MDEIDFQKNRKYIKQYLPYALQIESLENRLTELNYKIDSISSPIVTGQPGGGEKRELADDLAKKEELKSRIDSLVSESKSIKNGLLNCIDRIGNPIQANVLELRYIDAMNVAQIGDVLGYSVRQVIRQCNKGISRIKF